MARDGTDIMDANSRSGEPRGTVDKLGYKIYSNEDLPLCDAHAVLSETRVRAKLLELPPPPQVRLTHARRLSNAFGSAGEFITMKVDPLSSRLMKEFLHEQLVARGGFDDYEVCDVGFWDLDIATDTGFSWHNDNNWNSFLRPDHRTYHGWFVNSATPGCNSTLAVSTNARYNECNTNVVLGITDIRDNDVITPDFVAPLARGALLLFPYGAVHRTSRFKPPERMLGHRLCTSFVLHHKDDGLNDAKMATLTDDELCVAFRRYAGESALESGHYMVRLLESHPRTRPLTKRLTELR
jgi:hypothetical protein